MRTANDRMYRLIGIIVIIAVAAFFLLKLFNINLIKSRTERETETILEELRATTKIVIWEQDFNIKNVVKAEKQYFDQPWLTFREKVVTTAHGRMGFHIDLSDSVNVKIKISEEKVKISAPLQLTYVSIDLASIEQFKDASYDPTLEISKEDIIKRLGEIALREYLKPAVEKAKKKTLTEQEKNLAKMVGKPVEITLTGSPSITQSMGKIKVD